MTRTTRWLAATALATAGLTVFAAGGVSAIDIDTDADADTDVDQDADAHVGVFQKAWSNTGHNLAVNLTGQDNYADQDADSDAEGGDAELFLALFAVGGDGGTAGAGNGNGGSNGADVVQQHVGPVLRRQPTVPASVSARPTRTRRPTRQSPTAVPLL